MKALSNVAILQLLKEEAGLDTVSIQVQLGLHAGYDQKNILHSNGISRRN
jgi:diaminopimelate decarboxylase